MTPDDTTSTPWTATAANAMTDAELGRFLHEPHVARLATQRTDGFVHLTPVWFAYENAAFYFTLGLQRRHLRNLRRDPRATLLVDIDERPHDGVNGAVRAVMVCGTTEIETSQDVVTAYADRIDARYIGAEGAGSVDAVLGETYALVVLTPVTTLTWDFSKR